MAKSTPQIQEGFLFEALRQETPLAIQLVNHGELKGILKRFDQYTLLLDTSDGALVVYKSSVAAISADPAQASSA